MFDFDHLAPIKTARITLGDAIRVPASNPHPVVLIVRHAGDGNPAYINARAKEPMVSGRTPQYERQAKLLGRYVITDWEHVVGSDGAPIAFTPDLGEEMLVKLVHAKRLDVLDYLHNFATYAENFHDPIVRAGDLGNG